MSLLVADVVLLNILNCLQLLYALGMVYLSSKCYFKAKALK
jgi:hypothetical protein